MLVSYRAGREYAFIKDKNYKKLSKKEEKSIFKDVKSLLLYKLGGSISNGTDNMIISAFVGISEVGLLSNYTTITVAIKGYFLSNYVIIILHIWLYSDRFSTINKSIYWVVARNRIFIKL